MSSACKVVAQLSTSAQAGSRVRHMGSTVAAAATATQNSKLNFSSVSPWFFDAAHQEQWKSESLSKKAMAMQAVEKAVEAQSASHWKAELLSKRAVAMQAVEKAIEAQSVSSVNPLNFSSVSPWFFDAAHQEQWKSELLSKKAEAMQAVEKAVEARVEAQSVSGWRNPLKTLSAVEAQSLSEWKTALLSKRAVAMQAVEKAIEAQSVSTVNPLNFSSVSPWYFDAAHQEQWKAQMLRKKAAAMQDVEQAIEAQFVTPLALDFDASHQEQAQSELFRSVAMQPFSTSFGASPAYSQQSSEAASAALAELLHICVYNSETPSQTVSRRTIHSHGGVKGRLAVDSTKSHEPESQDVQEPEMAIRL